MCPTEYLNLRIFSTKDFRGFEMKIWGDHKSMNMGFKAALYTTTQNAYNNYTKPPENTDGFNNYYTSLN